VGIVLVACAKHRRAIWKERVGLNAKDNTLFCLLTKHSIDGSYYYHHTKTYKNKHIP
jgi:hypothetical protein